ncbi:site-specific integrase [Pseudaminobacter arsenicus]|uniref:Site-specific integrase n=2 Tax=Borborobacter arsenicus TaxID=1851146 RepID=A0A432V7D9_9HYPH|nr:site-specific integrase [Pseudaminobacter arsenicus]
MDKDRRDNERYYFRQLGKKKVRLREPYGSDAFLEELRCAREGIPYTQRGAHARKTSKRDVRQPAKAGTLLWLCQEYFRRGGAEVTLATMSRRRAILEGICKKPHPLEGDPDPDYPTKGSLPFAGMKRTHVKELRDTRLDAFGAANNIVKAVSAMFEWAKDAELVEHNPAHGIKPLKSGEGWHTWTIEEIVQFEQHHEEGSTARLALAIFMYTGLRLSDASIFGRQHIQLVRNEETGELEKWIKIRPKKTSHGADPVMVEIPLLADLETALAKCPADQMTYLVTSFGKPFTENGLGNKMREWCDSAHLHHCSAHGLRKAGATVAAENGATHEQLKAIYGWTTYKQPDLYIRKARRRKVAKAASHLLVFDRNENKKVPLLDGVELSGTISGKKDNKINSH